VFELLTDDLLFPYTPEAWIKTSQSKDSIALTAIISPDGALASPNALELIGFAISEPVNIAGTFQRSTAKVVLSGKVDTKLYTKDEISILSSVDSGLDNIEAKKLTK
jgi:hypothetical protein